MITTFLKDLFSFNADSPLLFTQFYFWAFFAFVFAGLTLLQNKILLRNAFLFFVSLFFYFKTSSLFVLILIFTAFFNFYLGRFINSSKTDRQRHLYLILSLLGNLFFLCYFKYAYFITDVINSIFHTDFEVFNFFSWIGNELTSSNRFDVSKILLPVGISFFTFQNISYIMDIYRKRIEPVNNVLNFGFYVCFFPSLVAGPIVRASQFIPQLYKKYSLSRRNFGIAIFWILNGLAKKIILSDYLAVNFLDRIFENPTMFTGFENLMALFVYSLQVYADFSGYTDIAIGVAMLMGFYLPQNFASPYKAKNPGNFWKRWHISLSKWLQDYLYIPMGGNRKATPATYIVIFSIALVAVILSGNIWIGVGVLLLILLLSYLSHRYPDRKKSINTNLNMMNTMLIGGIWHGASWNFMIWGGLNGLGMLTYKFWRDWNITVKTLVVIGLCILFAFLVWFYPAPVFNIGLVWTLILLIGTIIRYVYLQIYKGSKNNFKRLGACWAIAQTFVFISFTRLFFRSGSNLDPVEANQTAWNTAKNMVAQIGGSWNFSQIGTIIYEYRAVFLLFAIGMIIHWLPDKLKRHYRLIFSRMPLGVMLAVVTLSVFLIYQFVTADLQSFIYFQF
jgi:Predicted membrane protein involved in D-alanine export